MMSKFIFGVFYSVISKLKKVQLHRGRFLKKITLGTPSSSAEGARIEVWGVARGLCPSPEYFFSIFGS